MTDADCPGTDKCQTSNMGNVCRKDDLGGSSDGGVAPGDAGAPPPPGDGGLDTQAPVVTIASPPSGTVPATTKVVVQATDDHGVTKVELLVDGTLVASQNATPYEFPISLQPGAHALTAVARDAAGNQGQATVNVTVGGTGPAPQTDSGAPAPSTDSGTPLPGAPGAFGATCSAAADCTSKICASDPEVGASYCSQACGPKGWCPPGGVCVAGTGGGELCALELASDSGGCAVGRSAAPAGWLLLGLLGLLGLLVRRD